MGEMSCKCSQCNYTCTRVINLHTHMLTHTEVSNIYVIFVMCAMMRFVNCLHGGGKFQDGDNITPEKVLFEMHPS